MANEEHTNHSEDRNLKRKVEIDDLYRFRLVSDPQLSPDGRSVAYVQTRLRKKKNDYASNIWLVPSGGSDAPVKFTGSDKRDMSPRWSPNGLEIAFVSTRSGTPQVWVIRTTGGEARQLTHARRAVSDFAWSPDGKWIAFVTTAASDADKKASSGKTEKEKAGASIDSENREPGGQGDFPLQMPPAGEWDEDREHEAPDEDKGDHAREVTRLRYKQEGEGFLERRTHLFLVPSRGGDAVQLTEGDWDAHTPRWSPDGKQIAFIADQEPDAGYSNIQDIFVLPVSEEGKGGEAHRVSRHDAAIQNIEWLPDGQGFVAFAHKRVKESAFSTNLEVWTVSTEGEMRSLTAKLDRTVMPLVGSDLRSGGGESRPVLSADGSLVYFMVTNGGSVHVYSAAISHDEVKQVIGGPRQVLNFSLGPDSIVFGASTATLPNDLFIADLDGGNERRLTEVNADILPHLDIVEPRTFGLERPGGHKVQGWVMMPPGHAAGEKHPLILEIHGGPHTTYGDTYFHEFQSLAARGSIVLYTNPRGSQGYGQEFSDAIINDWGGVDYDDIMACLDHVIAEGSVDEEKLGVAGGSYGGYMTAWVIGHTQRFKAAVAMRAVTNLYSAWGSGDGTWALWNWELEGTPQERAGRYLERSPITYAPEMRTPLLLTHAEDDLRVNIEQSDELYIALKLLKRDVKMVRFPSGGHEVSRSGKPSLRVERLEHIAAWFDKYLHAR